VELNILKLREAAAQSSFIALSVPPLLAPAAPALWFSSVFSSIFFPVDLVITVHGPDRGKYTAGWSWQGREGCEGSAFAIRWHHRRVNWSHSRGWEALASGLGLTSVMQNRDGACLLPASFIASLLAKLRTFIKTVQYFI